VQGFSKIKKEPYQNMAFLTLIVSSSLSFTTISTSGNFVDSGSLTDLTNPNTIAHGNESFCSELRHYFDEIRNVTRIEDLTEEQFDAIGSLRVFLVEKLVCVDKFEDFEWD
jgi:hypothetical protein